MNQKINILAFAAHPDDVEISAAGILLKHQAAGLKTGIIDLTQGELSTRGQIELRKQETKKASEILKLSVRENLDMNDGFLDVNRESLTSVIKVIRKYKPDIILINSDNDRHPDHGIAHKLVHRAAFLSGLIKIETIHNNEVQDAWRPKHIYAYIQDLFKHPDLIIDVSDFWSKRTEALECFASQFYNPNSLEPTTPISTPEFRKNIEGRSLQLARHINCQHAEGLLVVKPIGVNLLSDIF
jgi:bacillithiol biosynthesis deacetylase BshB1